MTIGNDEDEKKLISLLHKVVGKYVFAILGTIMAVTVAGTVWATRTDAALTQLLVNDNRQEKVASEKMAEWNVWRSDVNKKFSEMNVGDRFTGTDWNIAAQSFNSKKPAVAMPMLWEINRIKIYGN